MNLGDFLTSSANESLQLALAAGHAHAKAASQRTHLSYLLAKLLDDQSVRAKLPEPVRVRAQAALAEQVLALPQEDHRKGELSFDLEALAGPAVETMGNLGSPRVTPLLFLATCLSPSIAMDAESERARGCLRIAGITAEMFLPGATERARRQDFTFRSQGLGNDGLGTDITAMARAGVWPTCPLVGMERQLENLVVVLNSMRYSAAIVGEPGVGKSAFIRGLAWHIVHRTRPLIPPDMDSWTLVRIEAADILKGTSGRGDLEGRIKEMLAFFARNPTVIPFFEEVHKLLDTDDTSSRAVATALKVPMAEERFRCVGVTTDREYARFIASDDAMNSRFRKILLPEPGEEEACRIVAGTKDDLLRGKAAQQGVSITDDAIRTAVRVTSVYQKSDRLPRKAINLLGETVAEKAYRLSIADAANSPAGLSTVITGKDVARFFSNVTSIPVDDLNDDRSAYYTALEARLKNRVRGQRIAIESVTRHLALHASGLVDKRRPRGRLLFLGPPGVGKTELATALAEEVMRDSGSLVTVNMAEYTKEDSLNKFMGASPGYVGFGQTPTIYSKVMMRSYSVVVLDEFEKAAPELANPLISMLDGRGEDSQGRMVDFSQCIFVMTSNALTQKEVLKGVVLGRIQVGDAAEVTRVLKGMGVDSSETSFTMPGLIERIERLDDAAAGSLLDQLGGTGEEGLRAHLTSLGGIWTAPLVDRIDRIALFRSLDKTVLHEILERMIDARRAASARPLPAEIDSPGSRDAIIGWATTDGAGTSARRLERSLLRWLSDKVLGVAGPC
ncbi:MAG: ATP-dependent Clp protease ATP-binding subunit [Candidatus Accumulibacter sp.]|uniref:ATP-dependent Clp protease ATP-binding subunit n=1 Tax=Candidatus Accumulibacter proximus TaxID=2954385 RepID=A0A935UES6_9PROT|nr:ATP-dependent Clp protease ATP-binding subunit [Candidatus Accumulibacter proximus]